MKIPEQESGASGKEAFIRYIVECCIASQQDRMQLYEKRRRYYLFGQNSGGFVKLNRLKSHLNLVKSFLFSQESATYSIAAPANADEATVAKYLAIEDDHNEEFNDCGLGNVFGLALLWSMVYDTMIVKLGWNETGDTGLFGQLVFPWSFGVFREDEPSGSYQPAMIHTYMLDYDDAVARLRHAGRADQIPNLQTLATDQDSGLPAAVTQLIIGATGGENLSGNIVGQINPDYEGQPDYKPRVDAPMIRFHEATVFDSDADDWRTFHMLQPGILLDDSRETISALKKDAGPKVKYASDTNFFLKGEHPYTQVTPFGLPDLWWGESHMEDLIPLQNWSNERLDQINEILDRQADPAKSFTGFMSQDEGKMSAWGGPGSYVFDQLPGAKAESHPPEMPEDLFAEFSEIGNLMLETSGLTEGIVGRGEKNVRGAGHHKELKITGGGRIRDAAIGLEKPLARMGDLALRLRAKNDDAQIKTEDAGTFVLAQVLEGNEHTIRIAGHSHSPLFTSETRELAAMLLKAQAIDAEWFTRLLRPPQQANILHALRRRLKAQAAQRAQEMAAGIQPGGQPRSHIKRVT